MTAKELIVLINDQVIGQVTQGNSGRFDFRYADDWLSNPSAIPLSLSMPLANPQHADDAIRPYMWGLLPDSEATLAAWATRFGASPRNPFSLLSHVGVIERYDRVRMDGKRKLRIDESGGEVRRVHQEDCCQALKVMPQVKYQNEGGPGIKDIMTLLSGSAKPSEDRDRFIRAQAYNFVIGGSDAHGKNYGLLLAAGGRFRLAPLYDVISILPYIKHPKEAKLAMSIDRHYRLDKIYPSHWEAQARSAGYSPDRSLAHIRDLIARLPDEAASLTKIFKSEGMHSAELDELIGLLADRCKKLGSAYGSEAMSGESRLPGI